MSNFDLHNIPLQEQAFHTFYILRSPEILEIMPRLGGI